MRETERQREEGGGTEGGKERREREREGERGSEGGREGGKEWESKQRKKKGGEAVCVWGRGGRGEYGDKHVSKQRKVDGTKEERTKSHLAPPPPRTSPIEVPVKRRARRAKSEFLKTKILKKSEII